MSTHNPCFRGEKRNKNVYSFSRYKAGFTGVWMDLLTWWNAWTFSLLCWHIKHYICQSDCLLSILATGTMKMNFDENHSLNVLGNQTSLQNSAYTTRKSLIFRVLCALFEQIPSGINRDIQKNPTWCGAKKVTNSVHLVIWSRGFPTPI